MSDLTAEPTAYESLEALDVEEALQFLEQSEADFKYWSHISLWSNEEGIALLLGKDPKVVRWDNVRHYVNDPYYFSDMCAEYDKLRMMLVRSLETQEIEPSNTPEVFLAWAAMKGLSIPEGLQQAMAARHTSTQKTPSDSDNLITRQAQEIVALKEQIQVLQQRIFELEVLQWPGFDTNKETYAEELVIAFEAYTAVSQAWHKGRSVKQQLMGWLKQHYPKLSKEATERIAKICNWQKEGGAPLTP